MSRVDWWTVPALLLVVADTVLYLAVLREQGNDPAWWALAVLVGAALALGYAVRRHAPGRRAVLAACATLLGLLGVLAILSIGLPILLAAAFCMGALLRGQAARRTA